MSSLVTITILNTKIGEVKKKIPDTSRLVTTTVLNTKNGEYITEQVNKLTAEYFAVRLKPADLVSKNDFDNKLISFNRKSTSHKTKYLEVKKNLNSLTTQGYNFFLGRIFFTSHDGSQKGTDYVLSWKLKGV